MPQAYKIPQNVELEDKILGPLTLKQFLMALGAGVLTFISYSAFYTLAPILFWLVTLLGWAVAGAFIFIRPNDQPFSKYIASFLWFALKPNRRVWKRISTLGEIKLRDETDVPKVVQEEPTEEEVRSKLQKLAHVVDTRGWSAVNADDVSGRVTSDTSAKPKLNIFLAEEDEPEDILQAEEEASGTGRATSELDRMLKQGVSKPTLNRTNHGDIRPKTNA